MVTLANRSNHQRIGHYSTEHYKGHDTHISLKNVIIPEQKKDFYLEVNDHSFPFKFQLPKVLPNSFEHPNGRTRYLCAVFVDIPW